MCSSIYSSGIQRPVHNFRYILLVESLTHRLAGCISARLAVQLALFSSQHAAASLATSEALAGNPMFCIAARMSASETHPRLRPAQSARYLKRKRP